MELIEYHVAAQQAQQVARSDVHNRKNKGGEIKWQIVRKLLAGLHNLQMESRDFRVLNTQLSALCNGAQGGAQVDWVICKSPAWAWIVNLPFSRRKETPLCRLLHALSVTAEIILNIAPSASWEKKLSAPKMDFFFISFWK